MSTPKPFNLSERIRSFSHAFAGIRTLLQTQHNARIHAGATLLAVVAGFFFGLSAAEWSALSLAICSVWITEALNTGIEFLADVASPEFHPLVKKCKDVAAAAVLIAAAGAVLVGLLLFGPHIGRVD